jgi:nucleotide-binding universal stress UspA family protein
MFKQIVVGVDEREGGRDAIILAKRLLGPGGTLTLASVYCGDPYAYRGASVAYEATERDRVLERLAVFRDEAGVDATLRFVGSTSVGRGLHELAEHEQADLLVLGSCRRSLVGRVLIGDDTHGALNGASCAVAVAPAGYGAEPVAMREIGVGYDESPESAHALEVARRLAAQLGARLSVLEVVSLPQYLLRDGSLPLDASIEDYVSATKQRLAALGGVEPHAVYGHPAEELALYSASLDLLVVGSRGYGPIGRLIHGSTSHHLARTARSPLLVLTRGARPAPPGAIEHDERQTAVLIDG